MASIKCPECQREAPEAARSCPHCGYPFKRGHLKIVAVSLAVAVVLIVIAVAIAVLITRSPDYVGGRQGSSYPPLTAKDIDTTRTTHDPGGSIDEAISARIEARKKRTAAEEAGAAAHATELYDQAVTLFERGAEYDRLEAFDKAFSSYQSAGDLFTKAEREASRVGDEIAALRMAMESMNSAKANAEKKGAGEHASVRYEEAESKRKEAERESSGSRAATLFTEAEKLYLLAYQEADMELARIAEEEKGTENESFEPKALGEAKRKGIAGLLPSDTIAYLRLSNLSQVCSAMEDSGFKSKIIEQLRVAFAAEASQVKAWDRIANQIQALHISFHGISLSRDRLRLDMDLLAIADVGLSASIAEWLSPIFPGRLHPFKDHGGITLHRFESENLEKVGISVFAASVPGRVFVSTDQHLLEGVLDALEQGQPSSLADNREYQTLRSNMATRDLELYLASSDLITSIQGCLDGRDRDVFRRVVELNSLRDMRGALCAADYDADVVTLLFLMDESSDVYRMLALPASTKRTPEYAPQGSMMFVAGNVHDGIKILRSVHRYLSRKLVAVGLIKSENEYYDGLKTAERDLLNLDLEDAAAVVSEIAWFMDRDADNFCVCIRVKDRDSARKLLQQWTATLGDLEETYEFLGVTIRVYGGRSNSKFVWCVMDDCVLLSSTRKAVKNAIASAALDKPLADAAMYRSMIGRLPRLNWATAYFNIEEISRSVDPSMYSRGGATRPEIREWIDDLACGISLTTKDGVVEVRIAQNKDMSLEDYFTLMARADQN